jgi:plastocyanin
MSFRHLVFGCFSVCVLVGGVYQLAGAHEVDLQNTTVVHMYDDYYEPQDVTISAGDTIIFENESEMGRWPASNIHPSHRGYPGSDIIDCNTEQERYMFDACREIPTGSTYTFTFTEPGVWPYHDHIEPTITGTITIEPGVIVVADPGLWERVKQWWSALWAQLFGQDGGGEVAVKPERPYDDTILESTDVIATDIDALYSYVRKFGAEQALAQLTALESQFGSCHDKAHDVGRFTYEEYGENAFKMCSMGCHSGCYHGAVESYFRENGTSNLSTEINAICAAATSEFVAHQCLHGLGHGLMAWSNYQLFEALEGCDLLDDVTQRSSCYSGIFMENIVQSMTSYVEIEGHTTEYISDDPHYPCTVVGDRYEADCYFLQTDRMLQLAEGDYGVAVGNCSVVENDYSRSNCFLSLGRSISGASQQQPTAIIEACSLVSDAANRQHCLTGAIQDTFWDIPGKDDGLTFCSLLEQESDKSHCYSLLIGRAPSILPDTASRMGFCSEIPERYQAQCRQQMQSM